MKTETEQETKEEKISNQPPVDYFYMPAMPPTELIQGLTKWVRKLVTKRKKRQTGVIDDSE